MLFSFINYINKFLLFSFEMLYISTRSLINLWHVLFLYFLKNIKKIFWKLYTNSIGNLSHVRQSVNFFIYVVWLNSIPMREGWLFHFDRWGNWGPEKLSNLFKVTRPRRNWAMIQILCSLFFLICFLIGGKLLYKLMFFCLHNVMKWYYFPITSTHWC